MPVSHALIVTLVLMVSPIAAAVCEVVCGVAPQAHHMEAAPSAAASAEHDEHAHHGHHAAPASEAIHVSAESSDGVTMSIPAPECDLRGAAPARVRTTFDVLASSAALVSTTYQLDAVAVHSLLSAATTSSPPAPPPLTPLPLRI